MRAKALSIRRSYKMPTPLTVYYATRKEGVTARWQEQPRVDRDNLEMDELTAAMANAMAVLARDTDRYEAKVEAAVTVATRAAVATTKRAR
jgi:hypothetical protein